MKIYIGLTRLLYDGVATPNYDLEKKLCKEFQNLDWSNDKKIVEAVVTAKNNKDKAKNPQKKNKKLEKNKIC